ncbi:MAG: alginate export family protein [Burkholderiales bacterium]|nr:alginate export family protein [Opitutaceae bacterium]
MTTRRQIRFAALASGLVALCSALPAQYLPTPPRPYPGLLNDKLRASDPYAAQWDVGVNIRGRYEGKDDAGFTAAGSNWDFSQTGSGNARDNNNHYFLTRVMPRVGYTAQWYQVFVEGRSSSSHDDERENNTTSTTPGKGLPENDNDLNLHQGYVFVGNHKQFPVSAKIGRQELVYGDQRQVGHFRWNNNARTFDAAKLRYQNALFGVDAFSGGLVYNDDNNFNKSHLDSDTFSGTYFNFVNIPGVTSKNIVEAYYYNRVVDKESATEDWSGVAAPFRNPVVQDLDVIGMRLKSKPGAFGAWDYTGEFIYQGGTINNQTPAGVAIGPAAGAGTITGAKERDQQAYAAIAQLGYTWTESSMQPRLSFTYSYASGDEDRLDGESNTFQNLYATTHLHYGYMDLNSLQNLHDFRTAITFKPTSTVTVALEHHYQLLDTTEDYWYNVAGVARNGGGYGVPGTAAVGTSSQLGNEIDLVVGWYPRIHTHVELGVSHYFAGDYIEESLAANGGAKDSSYVYLQLTLNL